LIESPDVDFYVFGEGEAVFRRLLEDPGFWKRKQASISAGDIFRASPSPYIKGLLDPAIEHMMLFETQRGCPYSCAYCYYNKSRQHVSYVCDDMVLSAVQWALANEVPELYLLDPSLNTRPKLKSLLKKIEQLNSEHRLSIISEIRAEGIDDEMASLFAKAGFSWFEIGLQSTNQAALKLMKRPTHLERFLGGISFLKKHEVLPRIDLIVGLPGDTLEGFKQSVDYLAENDLVDDVQVFPLSVLPGTEFRLQHQKLGLCFEPSPPYTIIETPDFSTEEIMMALDYAETTLGASLHPPENLNIAWKRLSETTDSHPGNRHHRVNLGSIDYISKLVLETELPSDELRQLASRLTMPYQIFFGPLLPESFIYKAMEITTTANPFTPLELVFLEPASLPSMETMLSSIKLKRPHFLDIEQRFLSSKPGNRAVLFTLVTEKKSLVFQNVMQRQIYWWKSSALPLKHNIEVSFDIDGMLIDSPVPAIEIKKWQDQHFESAADIMYVSFADINLQRRWLSLTSKDDFNFDVF
jgi:Radical SAM superfamily